MEKAKKIIKIGTRGSKLALVQTNMVIEALTKAYPELEFEEVIIRTIGDKILDKPLLEFGGKAVFVSEFEEALLNNEIDLAIHSAKDMPMELSKGLEIAGVLKREDPRDVLITNKSFKIGEHDSTIIGTSSLRRQIQIERMYDTIQCTSIRGNVNTRLQKLAEGNYDGIILAAAGIKRLNLENESEFDYQYLSFEEMVPAGGQGIIAIEGRTGCEICQLVKTISNEAALIELETERIILEMFGAGCHEPIGVISKINKGEIKIQIIKEIDGKVIKRQGRVVLEKRIELAKGLVELF